MIYLDANILNKMLPATSKDKNRPHLQGINIKDENGQRIYTATNGHLLLREFVGIAEGDEGLKNEIVLHFNKKIKTKSNELMSFDLEKSHLFGIKDDLLVEVSTNYPDTDRIIEDTNSNKQNNIWIPFKPCYLDILCQFFETWALDEPLTDPEPLVAKTRACRWEKRDYKGNIFKLALLMPVRI